MCLYNAATTSCEQNQGNWTEIQQDFYTGSSYEIASFSAQKIRVAVFVLYCQTLIPTLFPKIVLCLAF